MIPDPKARIPEAPRPRGTATLGIWLALSGLAHAAAVALAIGLPGRPPGDAEAQVISVELVLEAPSLASTEAAPLAGGAPAAPVAPAETTDAPDVAPTDSPPPARTAPMELATLSGRDAAPVAPDRPDRPVHSAQSMAQPVAPLPSPGALSRPRPDTAPAPDAPQALVAESAPAPFEPPSRALATAIRPLPRPEAPPEPQISRRAEPEAAREAAPDAPARAQSNRAAASAGVSAAYAQRLLAHVERHKRYPASAQRARIGGAARLAVTIDAAGALRDARLLGATGHEVLDREALATAARAAPYPLPEGGLDGPAFSFSVTLRFGR
ncbi:TonB family protein [Halovulum dunhuangense]|uniref:TonB family protein n=1 Tax=Halovulum dunhuangense TaxID=1505036 RepID=A0A849L1M8_9RHOB|nr:TonB family protein [Halovulum dunhuangense]NNU80196.1 TonB family protein [Halovulum dunhuangense]